ncbi:MAG: putative toxin-antitoxin system toxin component, PIN family [Nitrospirae bacterium]|nr:MAG: putative toxin-antitoxin system toxin component, PIN family [Nitrospirota bacterium]
MVRIVADTNVFVSSFFGGNARKVIDLWKTQQVQLCLSRDILDEYVAVLQRMGLKDQQELKELLNLFSQGYQVIFATNTPHLTIVHEDPADDKFIECAVALHAQVIVTGDKALRAVQDYMGIKIFTPREFLMWHEKHRHNTSAK